MRPSLSFLQFLLYISPVLVSSAQKQIVPSLCTNTSSYSYCQSSFHVEYTGQNYFYKFICNAVRPVNQSIPLTSYFVGSSHGNAWYYCDYVVYPFEAVVQNDEKLVSAVLRLDIGGQSPDDEYSRVEITADVGDYLLVTTRVFGEPTTYQFSEFPSGDPPRAMKGCRYQFVNAVEFPIRGGSNTLDITTILQDFFAQNQQNWVALVFKLMYRISIPTRANLDNIVLVVETQ